jgi:O-antigen/teichoic acid export membrane protein
MLYSFGAFVLRGVSFFLIPIYTRYLVPAEYGKLELLNTFASTLEIVFALGLFQVFYSEFFKKDDEGKKELVDRIISTYLSITTFLYVLSGFIVWIFHETLMVDVDLLLVYAALFISYLNFFQNCFIILLRLYERARFLTLLQVGLGIASVLMNLYFIVGLEIGIVGIIVSNLATMIVSNALAFRFYKRIYGKFKWYLSQADFRSMLSLSVIFIPGTLAFWLMNSVSRWVLLEYSGVSEVGIYSVAVKFSSLFDPLIIQPFLSSYNPRALRGFAEGKYDQQFNRLFPLLFIGFFIMGFVLAYIASFLIDEQYQAAVNYIPVLVVGVAISMMAQLSGLLLTFRRKVVYTLTAVSSGLLVSAISNFIFVKMYGGIGAAYGTILGNLVWMVLILVFHRLEKKRIKFEADGQ